MATLERLEQALQNAHNAGDTAAATKLAAAVRRARASAPPAPDDLEGQLEELFGETAEPRAPAPDPTLGDYGRAGLSLASSAVTGIPATVYGSIEGIGRSMVDGTYGTHEGAAAAQENVQQRQQDVSYQPGTPGGRQALQNVGEAIEPMAYLTDPLMGMAPMAGSLTGARSAFPRSLRRTPDQPQPPLRRGNAGAAAATTDAQRATMAGDLSIPMTGDRAPTLGQLTRDQVVLRREREMAKNDQLGGPLRERFDNQLEGLNANLENLEQQFPARRFEDRGIGQATSEAVQARKAAQYAEVQKAYEAAQLSGETKQPVKLGHAVAQNPRDQQLPLNIGQQQDLFKRVEFEPTPSGRLDNILLETGQLESLAPNAGPILKEAKRLGILDGDNAPRVSSIESLENLRRFTNKATDNYDRQQVRFRTLWTQLIDETVDQSGAGPAYKNARKKYSQWVDEFEETPITRDVTRTKRGTNERVMPYENVFKQTVLRGSVDEINKLRGTLLRSEGGKEAWVDLKARFARHIAEQSRGSNTAANGQPIISPYKLGKVIDDFDRTGKLESIFGKNGADEIRQLRETTQSMLTVPPNTVNASGTSAEIFNMLNRVARKVPFAERIGKAMDNRSTRREIDQSLNLTQRPDLSSALSHRPPHLQAATSVADRLSGRFMSEHDRKMEELRQQAAAIRNQR